MDDPPVQAPPQANLGEPDEHPVESSVVCVITRLEFRGVRALLRSFLDHRQVLREARKQRLPGLLRATFLIEGMKTFYSLSIWSNAEAIPCFGTAVPIHVAAANRAFAQVKCSPRRGPEIWSTKWKLVSVSNNLNWGDFDLRSLLKQDLADEVTGDRRL